MPTNPGGKYHVGIIADSMLKETLFIDIAVLGEGEEVTNMIIDSLKSKQSLCNIPNIKYREGNFIKSTNYCSNIELSDLRIFDYSLYPNIKSFPASIEISRGCPFKCNFCLTAKTKIRKKPIYKITHEIENLCNIYDDKSLKIYFETPTMMFSWKEIDQLVEFRETSNYNFTWRTETHVEYFQNHSISRLADAGLRVIDLGLESGSPQILDRMNKARNPLKYLDSASEVLEKAYLQGILIKINILFYIGETKDTIKETLFFLNANEEYIESVSAYPLICFPCEKFGFDFFNELYSIGGSIVINDEWSSRKLFAINSSSEFDYDDLKNISSLICKSYQSFDTFFKQKQYGYLSPEMSFCQCYEIAKEYGFIDMPFYISDQEKKEAREALRCRFLS